MLIETSEFPFPCLEASRCRLFLEGKRLVVGKDQQVKVDSGKQNNDEWSLTADSETGLWKIQSLPNGQFLGVEKEAGGRIVVTKTMEDSSSSYEFFWKIVQEASVEKFLIVSNAQEKGVLSINNKNEVITSVCDSDETTKQAWSLEFLNGELCHISSPLHDKRLQCNVMGRICMERAWGGWEVWRLIEAGNNRVFITSWTHSQFFLSSNSNGEVRTSKDRGEDELWIVEDRDDKNGIMIRSVAHNRLLRFDGKQLSTTEDSDTGPAQVWHLEAANRNMFYISCVEFDKRLSCPPKEKHLVATDKRGNSEEWEVKEVTVGRVIICSKTNNGDLFLSSTDSGDVKSSSSLSESEWWFLESSSTEGTFSIVSEKFERRLDCDQQGTLRTVPLDTSATTWRLEPRLPDSITGHQVRSWAAAGVATVGCVFAPSLLIVGAVCALGFTPTGIVDGSFAASMMSAEAVAAGGSVMAGGTVATLQSVGAAGLGALETSVTTAGGALFGSGVSTATMAKAGIFNETKEASTDVKDITLCDSNRPFCAWRSW